jgi:RNA polymerase sigma-70 factor, ECF subfamily
MTRTVRSTSSPRQLEQRFDDIVRAHRAGLLTYATRLASGDSARAEDVVQETFVRAWRQIDRLTPEYGSVGSWLRRVAYNVTIDGHRMRQVRPAEVELTQQDAPVHPEGSDEKDQILLGMVLRDVLQTIWPEHRAVLVEVYLRDRTPAEAATRLGIPEGTVKSRTYYALRVLRNKIAESELASTRQREEYPLLRAG